MSEVRLENVRKSFGGLAVIHGVDLTCHDGEFVVLVGPSGCGKSTLLRMIAGLEDISDGRISIGGEVVNDLEPRERDIAMVFQSYALYPHMNVEKNMSFSMALKQGAAGRHPAGGRGRGEVAGADALSRPPAAGAVGRPAAARGDGPGDRAPAEGRSSSTSRSPISMRSCVSRCAPRCASCTSGWRRPRSTSPTIRWRR